MTNKKTLIDKLLNNWLIKVVCLVIAIFLYIFHQASLIQKRTIVVPLNVVENGIVMEVGSINKSVSVVVRANPNDINSILNSDISAYVYLDGITTKGKYLLPVSVELSERLMEFDPFEIKVKTDKVEIEVDEKFSKYVPLVPSQVGETAHGYKVSEINMTPSVIQITGPKTIVDAVNQINTTKINVSNAEKTFSTEAFFINLSKLITLDNEGPYRATVVVSPIDHEAEFVGIKIKVKNLAENLELSNELDDISIRLAGSMPALEAYIPSDNLAYIDLGNITEPGKYDVTVNFNVPKYFDILDKTAKTVSLVITEKEYDNQNDEELQNFNEEEPEEKSEETL